MEVGFIISNAKKLICSNTERLGLSVATDFLFM